MMHATAGIPRVSSWTYVSAPKLTFNAFQIAARRCTAVWWFEGATIGP